MRKKRPVDEGYSRKVGTKRRCTAKCRSVGNDPASENRKGRQCRNSAVDGSTRCAIHKGGKELYGPMSPAWKGGMSPQGPQTKFDKVVPRHISKILKRLKNDPKLLQNQDEILLLDARIADLLSRIQAGITPDRMLQVRDSVNRLKDALREGDADRVVTIVDTLDETTAEMVTDSDDLWTEIRHVIEQRRKLIETERKIMESEEVMLTPDKLLIIAAETSRIVRKYIHEDLYEQFTHEFQRVFIRPDKELEVIDIK